MSLEKEKIEKIREMRQAGSSFSEIAAQLNISTKTAYEHAKDIEITKHIEAHQKSTAATVVRKKVEQEIVTEATQDLADILKAGKFLKDNYFEVAKSYGMTLQEFVELCCQFWVINKDYQEELEAKIEFHKLLIQRLLKVVQPSTAKILQHKTLEKFVYSQLSMTGQVQPEIFVEFLNKIWR